LVFVFLLGLVLGVFASCGSSNSTSAGVHHPTDDDSSPDDDDNDDASPPLDDDSSPDDDDNDDNDAVDDDASPTDDDDNDNDDLSPDDDDDDNDDDNNDDDSAPDDDDDDDDDDNDDDNDDDDSAPDDDDNDDDDNDDNDNDDESPEACCANGACYTWTASQCAAGSGVSHAGQACASNPCSLYACVVNGICYDDMSETNCTDVQKGTWYTGQSCADNPGGLWACCAHGQCLDNFSQANCTADDGVWHQGQTCAANPCNLGVCCNGTVDGAVQPCVQNATQAECANAGGGWQAGLTFRCTASDDDTVGDDDASPALTLACQGVCCTGDPNGFCADGQSALSCGPPDKLVLGVTCAAQPCAQQDWACCTTNGSCEDYQSQTYCEETTGGHWKSGKTCADQPCGDTTAACCVAGGCHDYNSLAQCILAQGAWRPGHTCAETNLCAEACCVDEQLGSLTQGCYDTVSDYGAFAYCSGSGGTTIRGTCAGNPCDFTYGSCCPASSYYGDCVDNVTSEACTSTYGYDGVWHQGVACADNPCGLGACCAQYGCYDSADQATCMGMPGGGVWHDGLTCAGNPCGIWACCGVIESYYGNVPGCYDGFTQNNCASNGGVWTEGLTCSENPCPTPYWACCVASKFDPLGVACEDNVSQVACVSADTDDDLAGTWHEALTCADNPCSLWACCGGNACTDSTTEASCTTGGGYWQSGLTCAGNPCSGACCISGTCYDTDTQDICVANGGTWRNGQACWDNPCG
jgi:hypothetical protein